MKPEAFPAERGGELDRLVGGVAVDDQFQVDLKALFRNGAKKLVPEAAFHGVERGDDDCRFHAAHQSPRVRSQSFFLNPCCQTVPRRVK